MTLNMPKCDVLVLVLVFIYRESGTPPLLSAALNRIIEVWDLVLTVIGGLRIPFSLLELHNPKR